MLGILLALTASVMQSHASDVELTKEKFISGLKEQLPKTFCKEGTYFRSCFSVDEKLCLDETNKALGACLSENEKSIPPQVKQPEEGKKQGFAIGSCMGTKIEAAWLAKKIAKPTCSDEKNWK